MSEEKKNLEANVLKDQQAEQVSGGKKVLVEPNKKEKQKNSQDKLSLGLVLDA